MATVTNVSSETFFAELKRITASIVWKNNETAKFLEVPENSFKRDMFMAACKGDIHFEGIPSFPKELLIKAGIITDTQIEACMKNKNNIPVSVRNKLTNLYINYCIDTYEEMNDYYRMLNGQPPYAETSYFYAIQKDDYETLMKLKAFDYILFHENVYIYLINKDFVPELIPLHELDDITLFKYEAFGIIEKIRQLYPSLKYLKYLTKYKIDLFTARSAPNFELLYVETSSPEIITDDFRDAYALARNYITRVYLTDAFRSNNDYYISFIGISILFMAIQQMNYKYLETDYTRDFYDVESLRVIYDSYGVPFFEEIPLKFHKRIVRNINRLISYKGSYQVLVDIFNLFDFHRVLLKQYYLVKRHKISSETGKPVFKFIVDPNTGEETDEYDLKKMFDLFFTEADIGKDPYSEIRDTSNRFTYNEITVPDEFWIEDEELVRKLYESEFNFIETKYFAVTLVFDMAKYVYESCYYLKMLQDNKESTKNRIEIYHDYLQDYVSLFDFAIYVICLICKSNGYIDPETGKVIATIPYNPTGIAKIYGFDFKKDLYIIQQDIINNPYLDNSICDMIRDMNIHSKEDVDKVYSNIHRLLEFLNYKIETASNLKTYEAYYELRRTLLLSEGIKEVYTKSDGTIALGYEDLLHDSNIYLYRRLYDNNLSIIDEIDYCLVTLQKLAKDLDEFASSADLNKLKLIRFLRNLITFFKSAKIDVSDFNIVYMLGSRSTDLIKFFMELKERKSTVWIREFITLTYNDHMKSIFESSEINDDTLQLKEKFHLYDRIITLGDKWLDDLLKEKKVLWEKTDHVILKEFMTKLNKIIQSMEELKMDDRFIVYDSVSEGDSALSLYAKIAYALSDSIVNLNDKLEIKDFILLDEAIIKAITGLSLKDIVYSYCDTIKDDYILSIDKLIRDLYSNIKTDLNLDDYIVSKKSMLSSSYYTIRDKDIELYNKDTYLKENLNYKELFTTVIDEKDIITYLYENRIFFDFITGISRRIKNDLSLNLIDTIAKDLRFDDYFDKVFKDEINELIKLDISLKDRLIRENLFVDSNVAYLLDKDSSKKIISIIKETFDIKYSDSCNDSIKYNDALIHISTIENIVLDYNRLIKDFVSYIYNESIILENDIFKEEYNRYVKSSGADILYKDDLSKISVNSNSINDRKTNLTDIMYNIIHEVNDSEKALIDEKYNKMSTAIESEELYNDDINIISSNNKINDMKNIIKDLVHSTSSKIKNDIKVISKEKVFNDEVNYICNYFGEKIIENAYNSFKEYFTSINKSESNILSRLRIRDKIESNIKPHRYSRETFTLSDSITRVEE